MPSCINMHVSEIGTCPSLTLALVSLISGVATYVRIWVNFETSIANEGDLKVLWLHYEKTLWKYTISMMSYLTKRKEYNILSNAS